MRKSLFVLLSASVLWVGCKKEETVTCQSAIRFINDSNYPFNLELDHKEATKINGKQTMEHPVEPGVYEVDLTQAEGFLVAPTMYEHFVTVGSCDTPVIFIHKTKNKLDTE